MDKCGECGSFIYDSSNRRKLQSQLIEEDERYESVVDCLCVRCLDREIVKNINHKILCNLSRKAIEKIKRESKEIGG